MKWWRTSRLSLAAVVALAASAQLPASVGAAAPPVVVGTGGMYTVTQPRVILQGSFAGIIVATSGAQITIDQATIDCSLGNTNPNGNIGIDMYFTPVNNVYVNSNGVTRSCQYGALVGGSNNRVNGGLFTLNYGMGVFDSVGSGTRVTKGEFSYNGYGIYERGVGAVIRDNTAHDNTYGILLVNSDGANVRNNNVTNNGFKGIIALSTVTTATIRGNVALGNGTYDLEDESPNCGNNIWRGNTFVTASQSCIG